MGTCVHVLYSSAAWQTKRLLGGLRNAPHSGHLKAKL